MSKADAFLIVVTIVAFIAGYSIVSFIVRKLKHNLGIRGGRQPGESRPNASMPEPPWTDDDLSDTGRDSQERDRVVREDTRAPHGYSQERPSEDEDRIYANILGLGPHASAEEVTQAYRKLIAKYQPERIDQMDEEIRRIAEIRRREIIEAYNYFRRKYDGV